MPRILTLISEARPDEDEVKSEAQFQRLVASCSESPSQSRVPRAASSRGRYPEEADQDEPLREDTPSDDGELDDTEPFAYTEPATSTKPVTPAQSVNGDDNGMLDSPGGVAMDVDLVSRPSRRLRSMIDMLAATIGVSLAIDILMEAHTTTNLQCRAQQQT
ncbi:hypothetical protein OBBRIDRAFT_786990 [Obba rivulosa]|uniref:Uncharacterized protein n=1 Tax=Obba rivulosa TaxID=1052685 RepID=A0A8E2DVL0_9APHY|nr:hypothetical protein OBBRIDRAFT_786990 [Obba rivulosa]